jgi:hypothetical protein
MNVDKTWDAFHAIRDVRDWGEPTDNVQTPRYGIDSKTGRHTEFYRINTEGAVCRTTVKRATASHDRILEVIQKSLSHMALLPISPPCHPPFRRVPLPFMYVCDI